MLSKAVHKTSTSISNYYLKIFLLVTMLVLFFFPIFQNVLKANCLKVFSTFNFSFTFKNIEIFRVLFEGTKKEIKFIPSINFK